MQNGNRHTPDDFWDIESLIPNSKRAAPASPSRPTSHTETTEIEFSVPVTSGAGEVPGDIGIKVSTAAAPIPVKPSPTEPELVYTPLHPLIKEVRIYPWRNSFRFYERFCEMAAHYFDYKAGECDPVPFFSYMPQYDQMNRAQLNWYFYWRDCVRAGRYPSTDYSYIFLYLFEIINLPERIPPEKGQVCLCEIWKNYRKVYPLLNRYLADWICDYGLIHRLPPPTKYLSELLPVIAENSTFKEFYACPSGDNDTKDAAIYLTFCTNYNYKKSKLYASGEMQASTMNEVIPGAVSCVVQALEKEESVFARTNMQKATLNRDSFVGALCSGAVKRRIEVEYCSFNRSHELRFLITDIVKYTENRIRAHFGMKSRLSVYALPDKIKSILDGYFSQVFPKKKKAVDMERPAYEVLYDLPKTELSFSHAHEIEQSSWQVTQELVEAFEEPAIELSVPRIVPEKAEVILPANTGASGGLAEALMDYAVFLRAIDRKNTAAQREFSRQTGKLTDAVIEEINEISTDIIGDILIADDGVAYEILDEYREEIQSLLNP